jgi:hypothetical protein
LTHPPLPRSLRAMPERPAASRWPRVRPLVAPIALALTLVFFRALSLLAMQKWDYELGLVDALAFAWDVPLAAALLALGRLPQLVAASPSASRTRSVLGWLGLWPVAMLVFAAFLARCADVAYTALTGGHWVSAGFLYVSLSNLALLHDGDGPLLVGCLGLASLVAWLALWFDARVFRQRMRDLQPFASVPAVARKLALVALLGLAVPFAVGFDAPEEEI